MKDWWKETIFYEIYMPSFCDSNNDGIGDFKGITSKLDYLKELGIGGIWLTPFYKSPKVDNGYDIEDYYEIDPDYGTLEDFKEFLKEAHKRDIQVISDLVLNHTSNMHKWFKESRSSKTSSKRNWYIWRTGNEGGYPNNWESFFSGSAWEYDENTDEYYYHAFAKEQVDLNWANPEVKEAMFDVIRYWLGLGIDGFRLDVINFLKTDINLIDNPYDNEGQQMHINDKDQEKTIQIIREIRALVDSYGDKFLVGEVGSEQLEEIMRYAGCDALNVVFNFNLGSIQKLDADKIIDELKAMDNFKDKTPTLFFGSHDMPRFISRLSDGILVEDKARLMAALMLTAKGVPFIYYGDEIGMRDFTPMTIEDVRDVQGILAYKKALSKGISEEEALIIGINASRDKSRTPMQWDNGDNAGFSGSVPWINIQSEYTYVNAASQEIDEASMLNYYKKLIDFRKSSKALQYGEYEELSKKEDIIYFKRKYFYEEVLLLFNFSKDHLEFKEFKLDSYNLILSSQRKSIEFKDKLELMPYEALIFLKTANY